MNAERKNAIQRKLQNALAGGSQKQCVCGVWHEATPRGWRDHMNSPEHYSNDDTPNKGAA